MALGWSTRSLKQEYIKRESRYNINMQNKIDLIKGAKVVIVGEVSGVDFDLRNGDVVTFESFDERPIEGFANDWRETFADEVDGDLSRLKGVMLYLDAESCSGWFPIDVQTKTILSY